MADWVLTNLVAYGMPMLLFIAYIGSLGIPFPITLVIMAAGAFTRMGLFDWRQAILACLAGAMLADVSEYFLGRCAGSWLEQRFCEKFVWQQAQAVIARQGNWAIFLTRFWLTPLAPEVNILAGSRYPLVQFLLFDFVGQFLWVLFYGCLGYTFTAQWQSISQVVGVFSALSVVLLCSFVAVSHRLRRWKCFREPVIVEKRG